MQTPHHALSVAQHRRSNVRSAEITKLPLHGLNKVTNPIFESLTFSAGGAGALVSCEFGHAESYGVELVWRSASSVDPILLPEA